MVLPVRVQWCASEQTRLRGLRILSANRVIRTDGAGVVSLRAGIHVSLKMHLYRLCHRAFALLAGIAFLVISGAVYADPPSRVARLGYTSGAVSFSPAGEDDWLKAAINRPLTAGDRLWSDSRSRAEVEVGGAMLRMHANTGMSVLNLDDRIAQLQLTQGTLHVRVRRVDPNQVFEIDTPNLAFTVRQPGEYRIEVDPAGNTTTVIVRKGQAEVYGEGASYVIDSRQPYRFSGTGLREYAYADASRLDEFDRWALERDRRFDASPSARYVSQDVVGYQDLDAYGTWRADPSYGNVWIPTRVGAGWVPYRDGHWVWVDPWGWTWVDDAPWGFAVSHYGRWANLWGTWGWVPGPMRARAYYAPALVAFVGGASLQLSLSSGTVAGVAWFPLGPREVYRPSYPVSRDYFDRINRSNAVISPAVVNNFYTNVNMTNAVYANRQAPGAVIAVPMSTFAQSQPVSRTVVRVTRAMMASATVLPIAPVAPTERSVRGAAGSAGKPPGKAFDRSVVARTAPPAGRADFAAQQQQLIANPGHPLDDAARSKLKPAAIAPLPPVKVVAPERDARPTQRPPPEPNAQAPDQRTRPQAGGKATPRWQTEARPSTPVPAPPPHPQGASPPLQPQGVSPPTKQPAAPAGRSANPVRAGQSPATVPAGQTPAPSAAPAVRPTEPATGRQTAPPRMQPDRRDKAEQRRQADAPVPQPVQRANENKVATPAAAPPDPSRQMVPRRPEQPNGPPVRQVVPPNPPEQKSAPRADPPARAPGRANEPPGDRKKDREEPRRDEDGRNRKG